MRWLSIDLGDRRTGLAIGGDETSLVSPLAVIEQPRGPRLIEAVAQAVQAHGPAAIVVGLPLNMDGTEGSAARAARALGDELARRCKLPVHFQDERLTSHAAEEHLKQSGRTHQRKKALRDALAAAEILRDFLEARRSGR